jgi:hypothetical protein
MTASVQLKQISDPKSQVARRQDRLIDGKPSVVSWKGAAIQRGLERGGRRISIVRSRYEATASEDTAGWTRFSVCYSEFVKCGD